ncbi:MAG: hypothetical protein D6704_01890 [Nitrospirae bacterium]|nr:MAG: hypothetical protein D6704_01890 [Nitrospirota bacterium]
MNSDNGSSPPLHAFDPTPLLLAPKLTSSEVARLLAPFGFRDIPRADANLQSMAGDPTSRRLLAGLLKDLLHAVAQTADPDQALNEWERYLGSGVNRTQLLGYLAQAPRVLQLVCTVFGNSPAMAQTLHRDPMLIYWVGEEQIWNRRSSPVQLRRALAQLLETFSTTELKCEALRRFHRRELLRIGVRDLLRIADVPETAAALSDLASVVIHAAYEIVRSDMIREFGIPMHYEPRAGWMETEFAVLGMGKLGGKELNYSSDVDLIYVYTTTKGATQGQRQTVSNEMFFNCLARRLTQVLSAATPEGMLYRVDLRLRPEGSTGALACALPDLVRYYRTRGRPWERLVFLKARPIAGSRKIGHSVVRRVRPFVVGGKEMGNETLLQAVRSLKQQIYVKMLRRGELERNVKLGPGGIRDIEFLVQTLQLFHGHQAPGILERNTLRALTRLEAYGVLPAYKARRLARAYCFLRDVEHKLQMVHEMQTHVLPRTTDELAKCARRLGYRDASDEIAVSRFLTEYKDWTAYVRQEVETFLQHEGRGC